MRIRLSGLTAALIFVAAPAAARISATADSWGDPAGAAALAAGPAAAAEAPLRLARFGERIRDWRDNHANDDDGDGIGGDNEINDGGIGPGEIDDGDHGDDSIHDGNGPIVDPDDPVPESPVRDFLIDRFLDNLFPGR
jgi:hypothetical protein